LPRTEIHKRVEKKAKELSVPFGTAKTNYNIVIKTLQNARMIYKSRNYYRTQEITIEPQRDSVSCCVKLPMFGMSGGKGGLPLPKGGAS